MIVERKTLWKIAPEENYPQTITPWMIGPRIIGPQTFAPGDNYPQGSDKKKEKLSFGQLPHG